MGLFRGLFDPEPEPGDRWRWFVVGVVAFALYGVLRMRAVRPFFLLAEAAIALVVLVLVVAGLARLLR